MNIFWHELKTYRRSTIIWAAVLALMVFGFLSLLPSFSHDVEATKKILQGVPPIFRAAFGIQIETFFTPYGFYAYVLTFVWLVGGIQAMNLGIGILSKEVTGKTADFLLSKPVTRIRVLTSKLAAILSLLVCTNIVFLAVALASAHLFSTSPISTKTFLLLSATLFFIQLMFMTLGFLISVIVPKIKSVVAFTLPVVFGFFIVGMLDSLIGKETARYVTPFKYFDPIYITAHNAYEIKYLVLEAVFIILAITTSYLIYLRKDIRSAT